VNAYLSEHLRLSDHFAGRALVADESVGRGNDCLELLILLRHADLLGTGLDVADQLVQGASHLSSGFVDVAQ
jgi:hypothetical protein